MPTWTTRLPRRIRKANTSRDGWCTLRRSGAIAAVALVLAVIFAGCAAKMERVELAANGQTLSVEVARTEVERERGLMGRKDLGPRDGMLFVFDRDDHLSFWMKNT